MLRVFNTQTTTEARLLFPLPSGTCTTLSHLLTWTSICFVFCTNEQFARALEPLSWNHEHVNQETFDTINGTDILAGSSYDLAE
jgi:hypothetical protein